MNESITRAAGARHGQEMKPDILRDTIIRCGREPRQRNTFYETLDAGAESPSDRPLRVCG